MLRGRSHVQHAILHNITVEKGSKDVVLVRGMASHCWGPGSISGPGVTCEWSLLFVMILAPKFCLLILWFSSLHKYQHSKFRFYLETVDKKTHLVYRLQVVPPFWRSPLCEKQKSVKNDWRLCAAVVLTLTSLRGWSSMSKVLKK